MPTIEIKTKSHGIDFSSSQRLGLAALLVVASTLSVADEKMHWAGPHVGIDTGYAWAKDSNTEYQTTKLGFGPNGFASKNKPTGGLVGAHAGYNFLFQDQYLLGISTEWKAYHADDRAEQCLNGCDGTMFIKSSLENKFSLLGKAGYLINNKTLLYVNGGWARAQIKREYSDLESGTESSKKWQDGWTAGFGGEYNFYENLTANIQYRYTDLNNKTINLEAMWLDLPQKQNMNQSEVTAGISYHF